MVVEKLLVCVSSQVTRCHVEGVEVDIIHHLDIMVEVGLDIINELGWGDDGGGLGF